MTDCFVFPDKLPKKSTRCLCVKITNQTSGPNNDSFLGHLITEGAIWTGIAINNATEVGLQQKHLYYWAKKFWHLRKV